MKRPTLFALLVLILIYVVSCRKIIGEGPVVSELRPAKDFTAIDSRISGDVYFKQDSVFHVEVKGQRNVLDLLETNVSGGELVIRFRNSANFRIKDDIDVIISAPAVSAFSVSGSGDLETAGNIALSSARFSINGSGDIRVARITATDLEASIGGSGGIRVDDGSLESSTLKITGSGSINLLNVSSKNAETTTNGSGTTRVTVSDQLNARITGSGNVYYRGRPAVNARVSGSGRVSAL